MAGRRLTELVEAFRGQVAARSGEVAVRSLLDGGGAAELTYQQLNDAAARAAVVISGSAASRPVLLACEDPVNFAVALVAGLIAGVPVVPVVRPLSLHDHRQPQRFGEIVAASGAISLIDDSSFGSDVPMQASTASGEAIPVISIGSDRPAESPDRAAPTRSEWIGEPEHGRGAFIQFSSGTTGLTKGAVISHSAALANIAAICDSFDMGPGTSSVSWLPLYHDMGLVGGLLAPLVSGAVATIIRPAAFIRNAGVWFDAISKWDGEISAAPDFAYARCLRRIDVEKYEAQSLSTWRVAINGSEPVRPETMNRFSETFADLGFRPSAFRPSYGLAESTLLVAAGEWPQHDRGEGGPSVSCGAPVRGTAVRVEGEGGAILDEGEVGELLISGPSLASRYLTANGAVDLVAADGGSKWFHTGDRGFLSHGEVHILGRVDSTLSVRGRTIQAEPVEIVVCGDVSVITVCRLVQRGAELALIYESARDLSESECVEIRQTVARLTGIGTVRLEPVVRGALPRTSSGKVRRPSAVSGHLSSLEPGVLP